MFVRLSNNKFTNNFTNKYNFSKIYELTCIPVTIFGGIVGCSHGYNYWKINIEPKHDYHSIYRGIGLIYGGISGAYLSCLWPATISIFGMFFIKEKIISK